MTRYPRLLITTVKILCFIISILLLLLLLLLLLHMMYRQT